MHAEGQVVKPDRRLRADGVASRILCAHCRRIEEDCGADGVAGETEDVEQREIRCQALRCLSLDVEDDLGIE